MTGLKTLCALLAFALSLAAYGAMFDLGRILDIGKDVAAAGTDVSEKDEIALGRELAGRTLGAAPLVDDADLQAYVSRVGRWVASQSERPDLPWRFGVMDTQSINAFAAPGGYVLITRGLYELLENEAQLAGVLGHEIAHIVRRHHITAWQKSKGASAFAGALQGLAGARDRTGLINNVVGVGAEAFTRALDRDVEYEADHVGVVLAARAGYRTNGLLEVLQKLRARASEPTLALLFSTHPHPNDRLTQLEAALAQRAASLPAGAEPPIQAVSTAAPASRAPARVAAPAGARALQQETQPESAPVQSEAAPQGNPLGFDPGSLLRGLIRR